MSAARPEGPGTDGAAQGAGPGLPVSEPMRAEEPGREPEERRWGPRQALADRQTDPLPETETEAQPVVAHQDRRHK